MRRATRAKVPKQWHILSAAERETLSVGPELPRPAVPSGKRTYEGLEKAARHKHRLAFTRHRRNAARRARGALEDLAWLAYKQDPKWLLEVFTERRPVSPAPTDDPAKLQGQKLGGPFSPLERFISELVAKIGESPFPAPAVQEDGTVGSTATGDMVAQRLATFLQVGLNAWDEANPKYEVAIIARPRRGLIHTVSRPYHRRPGTI